MLSNHLATWVFLFLKKHVSKKVTDFIEFKILDKQTKLAVG